MASKWFATIKGQTRGPMTSKELAAARLRGNAPTNRSRLEGGHEGVESGEQDQRTIHQSEAAVTPPLPPVPVIPQSNTPPIPVLDFADEEDDASPPPRMPRGRTNFRFSTKVAMWLGICTLALFLICCGIMGISMTQSQNRTVGVESDIIAKANARLAEVGNIDLGAQRQETGTNQNQQRST